MASNSVKFLSHKCKCTKEKQFIENTMQLEIEIGWEEISF